MSTSKSTVNNMTPLSGMIRNYSRGFRHCTRQHCRSLVNYAFSLNLLQGTGPVSNNDIKQLLSKRIVGKIRNDLQTNKRPFTLEYIVGRTCGENVSIDPTRTDWVRDKLWCGPIVLSCDLNKHSKEEASFLKGIESTNKYQIAVISDEELETMREQSSEIHSQFSFEIFSNPILSSGDSEDFFNTALKFLWSVNLKDNSTDLVLPTVQLRGMTGSFLRPSVLYYPQNPAQFYKCVLLNSFYKKHLKRKPPACTEEVSANDDVFAVESTYNPDFHEVRMAPIDILHHLNVSNNEDIVCLSRGGWSRSSAAELTTEDISSLCQKLGADVTPENILDLEDQNRTYYLVCRDKEDVTVLVKGLKHLIDAMQTTPDTPRASLKKKIRGTKECCKVVTGGLVFEQSMFGQDRPIKRGNRGAMFCQMPKAKSGRLIKFHKFDKHGDR